jgi:hypothetical protein
MILIAAHNQHELPKIPEVFFSNYSQVFYIYTKLIKVPNMELFFHLFITTPKNVLSL